ncbi:MAG: DUF5131 family protein [Ruminococcus sp.]
MINKKSKIGWCDFTWNPVTGCRYNCPYCYARKMARRFAGDVRINKGSAQLQAQEYKTAAGATYTNYILEEPFVAESKGRIFTPADFAPTLHRYKLPLPTQRKMSASIFVCSMADLFGDWIPDDWIREVFKACEAAPWHNYLFLTKNPRRYAEIKKAGWLPEGNNFWFGATATNRSQAAEAAHSLACLPSKYHTFVSIEPIAEDITDCWILLRSQVEWVILGAETGKRKGKVTPSPEWLNQIIGDCKTFGIPLLIKRSREISEVIPGKLSFEFPEALKPAKGRRKPPHCKECPCAKFERQGARGTAVYCTYTRSGEPQHIKGRYTRTSPEWCPRRKNE